ncbi:MAG: 3-methyl-2-oxobutanoate hydroxymethyltransferase [Candidatus Poribacteria bacterium]|nr:3-methyl-2-oxobutanoate hydroxymethyltransferase [Candidatus Poribacteria bacterium]
MKRTIETIQSMKPAGEKVVALTAYDYPTTRILNQAEVDIILVGDTLGMVVLGYESTTSVTMDDIVHHTRAVARGNRTCLLVADLPYRSYTSIDLAIANAQRLFEAGAEAVKLEGCHPEITQALVEHNLPVMGHVGLLPQTADRFRVHGRRTKEAQEIFDQAERLEEAGCFALVLESVIRLLAAEITNSLAIPTIGIGAGVDCDGQILVLHDMLGLFDRFTPTFVKRYADLGKVISRAATTYRLEVQQGLFPHPDHTYK